MYLELWCEDVLLPSPTATPHTDELAWDPDAGRATDALFGGDIVGEKQTLPITWGIITFDQYELIRDTLPDIDQPFKRITLKTNTGKVLWSYVGYRANISIAEVFCSGDEVFCNGITTEIIEQ